MYPPLGFEYCVLGFRDLVIYAKVLRRESLSTMTVHAYSRATGPRGEQGSVYIDNVCGTLTDAEFETARELGWPDDIEAVLSASSGSEDFVNRE